MNESSRRVKSGGQGEMDSGAQAVMEAHASLAVTGMQCVYVFL